MKQIQLVEHACEHVLCYLHRGSDASTGTYVHASSRGRGVVLVAAHTRTRSAFRRRTHCDALATTTQTLSEGEANEVREGYWVGVWGMACPLPSPTTTPLRGTGRSIAEDSIDRRAADLKPSRHLDFTDARIH